MSKRIDLVGETFGKLTVIKFAGLNKWSRTMWQCECACGTKKIIDGTELRSGDTKSCGNTGCRNNSKNLSGMKFGRLRVLYLKERQRWVSRCECGKEKVIDGNSLIKGRTKSCGCLQNETRLKLSKNSISKTEILFGDYIENEYEIKIERQFLLCGRVFDIKYKNILIESDGSHWHKSSDAKRIDKIKNRLAAENGYTLLRFKLDREKDIYKKWNQIKSILDRYLLKDS